MACEIFEVSKSAHYEWVGNYVHHEIKRKKEHELAQKVVSEFNRSKKSYGATRILKKLTQKKVNCTYKQILEIMKVND